MTRRIGSILILLGVLCVLAAFCIDANRAPDWMISRPAPFHIHSLSTHSIALPH